MPELLEALLDFEVAFTMSTLAAYDRLIELADRMRRDGLSCPTPDLVGQGETALRCAAGSGVMF